MIPISDAFSLVYFRYEDSEKYSRTAKDMKERLEKFKIYRMRANAWGGTITLDKEHEYMYTLYRCVPEVRDILVSVDNLYEWDYKAYPMDLSFFRDGYSFLCSTAHASSTVLLTDDEKILEDMKNLGLDVFYMCDVPERVLFFDERSKCKNEAE